MKRQSRKVNGRFDSNESKIKKVPDSKVKQAQTYRKLIGEEIADRLTKPVDTNMELKTALKVFGIPGCLGVSAESFKILYKGLSVLRHPDHASGNADRMAELNIARKVIKQLF